jgi:rare lipoprotein A (peptidoglycan hydrolase)
MTVRYDRVSTSTHQMTLPIQMPVQTRYTSTMTPGKMVVLTHGSTGTERAAVEVTSVNGHVVSRRVVSQSVLAPPVPELRLSAPYSMSDGVLREPGTGATAQTGEASWYDPPWSGLTAAHPWLPFGTHVTVTDLDTGRSVTVVIDDRGPFGPGRIIDLSPEAFAALQPLGHGVLHVSLSW